MSTLRRLLFPAVLAAGFFPMTLSRAADRPDPKLVSIKLPDEIQWKKAEASDQATIQGDPSKPGIYIQLIKWHPGHMSRPHFHAEERYIWVISGTWWVGTGPHWDPNMTYPVPAGSFVVDHPGEIHWDGAKPETGDCVLYIVGMGPSKTTQAEEK